MATSCKHTPSRSNMLHRFKTLSSVSNACIEFAGVYSDDSMSENVVRRAVAAYKKLKVEC